MRSPFFHNKISDSSGSHGYSKGARTEKDAKREAASDSEPPAAGLRVTKIYTRIIKTLTNTHASTQANELTYKHIENTNVYIETFIIYTRYTQVKEEVHTSFPFLLYRIIGPFLLVLITSN